MDNYFHLADPGDIFNLRTCGIWNSSSDSMNSCSRLRWPDITFSCYDVPVDNSSTGQAVGDSIVSTSPGGTFIYTFCFLSKCSDQEHNCHYWISIPLKVQQKEIPPRFLLTVSAYMDVPSLCLLRTNYFSIRSPITQKQTARLWRMMVNQARYRIEPVFGKKIIVCSLFSQRHNGNHRRTRESTVICWR